MAAIGGPSWRHGRDIDWVPTAPKPAEFVFTPGRGGDPKVLDVWVPVDGQLTILGNVYRRGRQGWAARWSALGSADRTGLPNRVAAARALVEIAAARKAARS